MNGNRQGSINGLKRNTDRLLLIQILGKSKTQNFWLPCTFGDDRNRAENNGIFFPKLFWPTVRKYCSSDWEKLLKFEAEGQEVAKILRSLEQFIQTVKGQNNFW